MGTRFVGHCLGAQKLLLALLWYSRAAVCHTWDAAVFMRTDPPRVSDIRRGKLGRFSLETLVRYLARMGYRVEMRWEKRRLNEHRQK